MTAIGLAAGLVTMTAGERLRRQGRWSANGLRWVCFGTGTLGGLMLVVSFLFPQVRGRTPPRDGVEFTPIPFTDPLVLSCGVGAFALTVGLYLVIRGDRSWPSLVGLGAGAFVSGVWLFYLIGRFVG